jgi:hypothetical protein
MIFVTPLMIASTGLPALALTSSAKESSVPGKTHTATSGSQGALKPFVIELLNSVVTSFSPTLAGRDNMCLRL